MLIKKELYYNKAVMKISLLSEKNELFLVTIAKTAFTSFREERGRGEANLSCIGSIFQNA